MDKNGLKKYMNFRLGTFSELDTYSIKDWIKGIKTNTKATLNKIANWIHNNKTVTASIAALAVLCLLVSIKYRAYKSGLLNIGNDLNNLQHKYDNLEYENSENLKASREYNKLSRELEFAMINYTSVNANKDNPALAQRVEFLTETLEKDFRYVKDPTFQEILETMAFAVRDNNNFRPHTKRIDNMLNKFSNDHNLGRLFVNDWEA